MLAALQAHAAPEPQTTAECAVDARFITRRNLVRDVTLTCPSDAPDAAALQSVADRHVERLNLQGAQGLVSIASSVAFQRDGDAWFLPGPAKIVQSAPSFPARGAERGVVATCEGRVTVGADGRAQHSDWRCLASHPEEQERLEGVYVSAVESAAGRYRWLIPLDRDSACVELGFDFQLHDPDGYRVDAPAMPEDMKPQCPEQET